MLDAQLVQWAGQTAARSIERILRHLPQGRSAQIEWVKGHSGVPGNTTADTLASAAASRRSYGPTPIAYLNSRISELFRDGKEK